MTRAIGKLTDTPDVGDPIVSPWYQEIATYARHIFATSTELNSEWSNAPDGAHAWTTGDRKSWVRVAGVWTWDGPQARIAHAERGTDAGPVNTGAPAAIGSLTVTITLPAQRWVEVVAYARHFTAGGANQYGTMEIRTSGNQTLADGLYMSGSASPPLSPAMRIGRITQAAAGSTTLNVWLNPAAGSVTLNATVTSPAWIAVYDLGPT